MKYLHTLFLAVFLVIYASAQNQREHFRGGMFPHIGILFNSSPETKINGLCTGIGGKLVFPVSDHLRIGTEGYVTTYNYKQNEGFYNFGWGGVLFEYQLEKRRFMPVIGMSVGGGGSKDIYPIVGNYMDNIPDIAVFKKYGSLVLAPQFSLEYSLTSHINLAAKIDYLLYPGSKYGQYLAKGARMYFGVLFSR